MIHYSTIFLACQCFFGFRKKSKIFSTFFQKRVDKSERVCYNITVPMKSTRNRRKSELTSWCGSMAEHLICNQAVDGSTPFTSSNMGDFPSGQRGQTVNLLSLTSVVRIHHPPPNPRGFILGDNFLPFHFSLFKLGDLASNR